MPDSSGLEALLLRLYLDRHIMARLAADLRGRGYDVVRTEEAGKDTATDEEQLAFAMTEGRSILTFNIRDFAPIHDLLLGRMLRLLNHLTAEEMIDNFVHLEQFK